ncbi:MAG: hypothetical protein ACRD00_02930 [Thermoanaerobaculia bacterium]
MRTGRRPFLASLLLLIAPAGVVAQGLNLRDLLTDFLRAGITLAPPAAGISHVAHFQDPGSPQFQALTAFNTEIAGQLSSFPLASSGGGFTYRFDPDLGVLVRTTDSFGPVYTERADTIGKGRFDFGMNYSAFTFDTIDGLSLRDGDLRLVFTHAPVPNFVAGDVITSDLRLKLTTNTTAFVLNYGLFDAVDVGVVVPLVKVDMQTQSTAQIQRLATGLCCTTIHLFVGGGSTETFSQSGSASGLGDILARTKFRILRGSAGALAVLANVRVPTGEERDLLGSGTTQATGALVGSLRFPPVSVHGNAGYTWAAEKNGVKVVPDQIVYNFGLDVAVHPRLTLVGELVGRVVLNTQRVLTENHTYTADRASADQSSFTPYSQDFPRLVVAPQSNQNRLSCSVGLRINPVGNLLVTLNGLFPLDSNGLQDKFTPLIGIDYSF